jgi:hypothetical protein
MPPLLYRGGVQAFVKHLTHDDHFICDDRLMGVRPLQGHVLAFVNVWPQTTTGVRQARQVVRGCNISP